VSPAAVVAAALDAGLTCIALTDHDTAAGVPVAWEAAEGTGLTVLAGIEVSATWERGEVHILGYGVDPAHPAIVAHGAHAATRRSERMEGMVARLQEQGVHVTMAEVEAVAGVDRESLARPTWPVPWWPPGTWSTRGRPSTGTSAMSTRRSFPPTS
jgi:3',5'-nucleoside bisphosphate phosphatase